MEVIGAADMEVIGIDVIGAAVITGAGAAVMTGAGAGIGIGIGAALTGSGAGALPATGRYDGVLRRRTSSCNASMYAACCLCEAIKAFKSGPACVFTSSPTKIAQVWRPPRWTSNAEPMTERQILGW